MRSFTLHLFLLFIPCLVLSNTVYCDNPNYFIEPSSTWTIPQEKLQYQNDAIDEKGDLLDYFIYHTRPIDSLNASVPKRPHVMGVHGLVIGLEPFFAASFSWLLGDEFSKYGYGSSSIEYRSFIYGTGIYDICSPEFIAEGFKTFYRSIYDTRAAINYLFDNADALGIDTSNFFLYGNSLGATSIMQATFVENEIDWLSKFPQFQDLILNDPQFTPWPPRRNIAGVISVAGNLHHLDLWNEGNAVPLFMAHGVCDDVTPFGSAPPLGCTNAPEVYGPVAIVKKAIETNTPYSLHAVQNLGHGWSTELNNATYPIIRDWLKNQIMCGTPLQECFQYENTSTDPDLFYDCPQVEICDLISPVEDLNGIQDASIRLFPNPSQNEVQIDFDHTYSSSLNISVFTTDGKQVLSNMKISSGEQLKLNDLESGIYFFRILDDQNMYTKTWVKY